MRVKHSQRYAALPIVVAAIQTGFVTETSRYASVARHPQRRGIALAVGSMVSVQTGAAIATGLFDTVRPSAVVALRLGLAGLVLGLAQRNFAGFRAGLRNPAVLQLGVALACMNLAFYQAIARLPLGLAVAIELLGPLGLAAALSRRRSELVAIGVAAIGVAVLCIGDSELDLVGVGFALMAALGWASYIVLGERLARTTSGIGGLAPAFVVGSLLSMVPAAGQVGEGLPIKTLLPLASVALLSAIIPMSLDASALRTLQRQTFGLLMSLSPVIAALAARLVDEQVISLQQGLAMVVVTLANVLGRSGARSVRRTTLSDTPSSQPSPTSA